MPQLRIRKSARAEIVEAFDWYLERSPFAAARFLDAIDRAMIQVEDVPHRYPVIHGRLRRVLLPHFPFAVYYKIYPSAISVVGVIHGRRHPDTWLKRSDF
jgi:plasmid stabilization system protein ParE